MGKQVTGQNIPGFEWHTIPTTAKTQMKRKQRYFAHEQDPPPRATGIRVRERELVTNETTDAVSLQ